MYLTFEANGCRMIVVLTQTFRGGGATMAGFLIGLAAGALIFVYRKEIKDFFLRVQREFTGRDDGVS